MWKRNSRRKNYFINKKFQLKFAIPSLVLMVLVACGLLAVFLFNSKRTLTAGYSGFEVKVLHTADFFLPMLVVATISIIIVIGIIAIIALIYVSHRIVGPIYRFHQALTAIDNGDLTLRFKLRKGDQFMDLADRINALAGTMDGKIRGIKAQTAELARLADELLKRSASDAASAKELEGPLREISKKLAELHDAANHFKTSRDN